MFNSLNDGLLGSETREMNKSAWEACGPHRKALFGDEEGAGGGKGSFDGMRTNTGTSRKMDTLLDSLSWCDTSFSSSLTHLLLLHLVQWTSF